MLDEFNETIVVKSNVRCEVPGDVAALLAAVLHGVHVGLEPVHVSEVSILLFVAAQEQKQFTHLSTHERRLLSHHIIAKNRVP